MALQEFDYVVVGGGSAGCVMASRLSEDPNVSVALLEAGPTDSSVLIHCPLGIALMAQTLQRNRAARDAHEQLVARVAREMQRAGRIVWRGLSLRARVAASLPWAGPAATALSLRARVAAQSEAAWAMAMPDVFSIRHTTVEAYLEPVVHEIKVRRADLLADLRRPAKGQAYRDLSSECWYVLRAGLAEADEIPPVYGVMIAHEDSVLEVLRPAPKRPITLPFGVWMALARAAPEPIDDDAQAAF